MCSLYRLPVAKNHNFGQILTFGGSPNDLLLSMRVKFGVLEQTHSIRLRARIRLNRFILSSSGGENPPFLLPTFPYPLVTGIIARNASLPVFSLLRGQF